MRYASATSTRSGFDADRTRSARSGTDLHPATAAARSAVGGAYSGETVASRDKQRPRCAVDQPQRGADGNHRPASGVHSLNDLAAVDALQVDGRDVEVAVSELAPDDDQRHAFARHLDGMGVPELVWREPAPHSCRGRGAPKLGACRGGRPVTSACCAVDDAQHRTDRKLAPHIKPGLKLFPAPRRPCRLATAPALAAPN